MCGIVGALAAAPVPKSALDRSLDSIQHRGPDGRGIFFSPDQRTALGHVRLSVIDLESGAQPLFNESRDLTLVVNGELYGYQSIRQDLEKRGHRLGTHSDSEVLLHLYEDLGVDCLKEARGEFAFILWDARKQRLFAARDRFGIKPLHYAWKDGSLYLASEIKALLPLGVEPKWNRRAFAATMCGLLPVPQRETLFEGVAQIPPGHFLLAEPGHPPSLHKYWDLDIPTSDAPERSFETSVEQFRELLQTSVRERLVADVPVGVYLSGGIDSSTILGMAAESSARPLEAYTIGFEDEALDERATAARSAQRAGAEFFAFDVRLDDLADHFAAAVRHSEVPHDNPHGTAKYLLSRFVRNRGTKVVLGGEGADELFFGYPWLTYDLVKNTPGFGKPGPLVGALGPQAKRASLAIQAISVSGMRHPSMVRIQEALGYIPSSLALVGATFMRPEVWELLRPEVREDLSSFRLVDDLLDSLDVEGQMAGRARPWQSAYLQFKSTFLSYNLPVLGDRVEMAHGVEARLPFLDHRFVEAVRATPLNGFFAEGQDKRLLRAIARPVVTEEVLSRPKLSFMAPDVTGHGRFGELVRDLIASSALDEHPLYDPAAVRRIYGDQNMFAFTRSRVLLTVASGIILQRAFRPS